MKLDLGVLSEETLDIKLPNAEVLSVKIPSKKLMIELYNMDANFHKFKDAETALNGMEDITCKILSNNKENKKIDAHILEENNINYSIQLKIFRSYMKFVEKFNSNPN